MKKLMAVLFALFIVLPFSGCSTEPGTKAWCENIQQKDKGKWTVEEAGTFTKYCLMRNYKE